MAVSAAKNRSLPQPAEEARAATTHTQATGVRAAELLKEILDYQLRLNRLSVRSTADEDYLISAYKRQIKRRQHQLDALPKPVAAAAHT